MNVVATPLINITRQGRHADFVLLQARDKVEAIRLRATRLKVFRRGQLIAETPASTSALYLAGRPASTSLMSNN